MLAKLKQFDRMYLLTNTTEQNKMIKSIETLQSELRAASAAVNAYEKESGNSFSNWSLYPEYIQVALNARKSLASQIRAARS